MDREARYDAIVDFYEDAVGDDVRDPVAAAVFDLLGDKRGKRVLELACGQGRVSRELARRGAFVTGIDLSSALLERARDAAARDALPVVYVHADATGRDALAGETFDAVVCHFGLSDIDELDGALATVARVLRPGGVFVFSILHPCFPGGNARTPSSWPPDGGYHSERWWLGSGPGIRGKVGSNHRMLGTYLNALVDHGLAIDRVVEPEPEAAWAAERLDGVAVPVFLVVRCRAAA